MALIEVSSTYLHSHSKDGAGLCVQVSLNWVVCKGALPIPGVKNAGQAEEAAGALGWRLTDGEVMELDRVSAGLPQIPGVDLGSV